MKITFVGTCQVAGMAEAASRMLPNATITHHAPLTNEQHFAIADAVRGSDFAVTQLGAVSNGSPLSAPALADMGIRTIYLPVVVFTGFHPDMAYISADGRMIDDGLSAYHSQIALAAFLLDLPIERALQLYNAHVFAELGYFAAYDQAIELLAANFLEHGYKVTPLLERLRLQGHTFMHTINHPSIRLLERLAAKALARLDVVERRTKPITNIPDHLGSVFVGPVHEPIARRLGVSPRETYYANPPETMGGPCELSIRSVLEIAYRRYATYDRNALRTSAIAPVLDRLAGLLR